MEDADKGSKVQANDAGRQDGTKPIFKTQPINKQPGEWRGLEIPARSQSPDTVSLISAHDFTELQLIRTSSNTRNELHEPLEKDSRTPKWKRVLRKAYIRNKGLMLMLIAMFFGTLMNVTARLLEDEKYGAMHPFQILFARMSITVVLCLLYMWWKNIPDWPLGPREVRVLLVARGTGGFFGVYGMYWSLKYLDLSDATVLTFIAPFVTCWACAVLVKEPFTRIEKIGGLISLAGVVLIARPSVLFHKSAHDSSPPATGAPDVGAVATSPTGDPAGAHRLTGVAMSMVGVVGASIAYTTIRWIGKRAHSLVSVNYFAFWCTFVSLMAMLFIPSVPFILPASAAQWGLLIAIGTTGFAMQFLMTAGLQYEKSSRATNMVYSQELFALLFDKIIWGVTPGVMSAIGSSLILGSAIVVALQRDSQLQKSAASASTENRRDEEMGLLHPQESGVVGEHSAEHTLPDPELFSEEDDSPEHRDPATRDMETRHGDREQS